MTDTINFGDTIRVNDIDFTFLDVDVNGGWLCVTSKVWKRLKFCSDRRIYNNWTTSSLRDICNTEFLSLLDNRMLLSQVSDLTADNGDDSYGKTEDVITLLTCDQLRRYYRLFPNWGTFVWSLTPCYCGEPGGAVCVRGRYSDGTLGNSWANNAWGVSPACSLNPAHLKLRRQAQIYIAEYCDTAEEYEIPEEEIPIRDFLLGG